MAGLAPARLRPCRPLHQTPVVSYALAIPHPGLLPSGACTPSAFAAIPLRLSCCPRLYLFRGSITRPASSLPPASYTHCWAGTWSALLTCWRGVSQVGLEPEGSHPLGNNNQLHRISPTPKVSGLPWREQTLVRRSRARLGSTVPDLDRQPWNPRKLTHIGGDHGEPMGKTGGCQP